MPPEIKSVKDQIEFAFLTLVDKKPYDDITVSDIVREAGVARASFYRNFSSISDIIESVTDHMAEDFFHDLLPMLDGTSDRKLREFLFSYFYHISLNSKKMLTIQKINRRVVFGRLNDKIASREREEGITGTEAKYTSAAKMALLEGVADKWVNEGMQETPEEMIDFVMNIMKKF